MKLVVNVGEIATKSWSFLINLGMAVLSALAVLGQMWVMGEPWTSTGNLIALFTFGSSVSAAGLRLVDQGLGKKEPEDPPVGIGA